MSVRKHVLGKVLCIKTEGGDPGLGSSAPDFQWLFLQAFSHNYQKQFARLYKISTLLSLEKIWKNFWYLLVFRNPEINSEHILCTGMELNWTSNEMKRTEKVVHS